MMRLPRGFSGIDQEKTNARVLKAIEGGVNYFDTAYVYPGSEVALGLALQATGLPEPVTRLFNAVNPDVSMASWALRWLWDQPKPTVVLSGMSMVGQLDKCITCRACEAKCPQGIKIIESLVAVRKRMQSFWFKPVMPLIKVVMR
jgi:predicted aldo/keto reductase-like oxidoreductase